MRKKIAGIRFAIKGFVTLTFVLLGLMPNLLSAQKKKQPVKPEPVAEPARIVSYEVLENGDTINRIDSKNVRHGKWLIEHEASMDEPGTMELGEYEMGVRNGKWKTYSLHGDLEAEEFYKKGLKDGEARYYEEGRLICVGNYLALNAKQKYDTVMVENPLTNESRPVRIRTDVGSVRHGSWTFYDARTSEINRVVEYEVDEVVYDKSFTHVSKEDSLYILAKMKTFPHITHKPDENVWMSKGNQKRITYTDIPDNKPVKPNVRKK